MRRRFLKNFVLSIFLLTGGIHSIYSQKPVAYYYENEFDFSIPLNAVWSIEAGIGNRGILAEVEKEERKGYQNQHVEISHFTHYQSSETLVLCLGLRYRLRDIFYASETNDSG